MYTEHQRVVHLDAQTMQDEEFRNAVLARMLFNVCEEAELTGQTSMPIDMPIIVPESVVYEGVQAAYKVTLPIVSKNERSAWYVLQTHKTTPNGTFGPLPKFFAQAERREIVDQNSGKVRVRQDVLEAKALIKPLKLALTSLGVLVIVDPLKTKRHGQSRPPGNK